MSTIRKGTASKGIASLGTISKSSLFSVGDVPGITITSGAPSAINENSGDGQNVYTVTARDKNGSTSGFAFAITGTDEGSFSINSSSGVVTLTGNPNFEAKGRYEFTVEATKSGLPKGSKAIVLNINNLDEVAPTITSGATATAIAENSGAGQVIYTVTVDDSGDISGGVTFTKSGTDQGLISIDSTTGAVTLIANPDFETKSSYSFNVIATDAASNSSTQAVTLAITNVVDVVPSFTASTVTRAAIAEDTGNNVTLYSIGGNLVDPDNAVSDLDITDVSPSISSGFFAIDGSNNLTTGTAVFDHESATSHAVTINASYTVGGVDGGISFVVNVPISDRGISFAGSATSKTIAENSGAGQLIYQPFPSVFDPQYDTSDLTYSLSGADASHFTVQQHTGSDEALDGSVYLTADPDYETKPSYAVTLTANGPGSPPADTVSVNVTVTITDVFEGLSATGTLGRYSPTGGLYFHGYEDSQSLPGTANSHRGTLSPLSDSAFYSGATVTELGYGKSQYSSATGTEFKIALSGDTRSQSGFKLVFTDTNNVSRTFRTTDSNMYSESYNTFAGQTLYSWDVTDSDAQAVNVFTPFLGISGMSVGTSYTVVNAPYGAHQSGSPGAGNNSSSDRGQALISIGTVAAGNGYFSGARVIANSNISNATNITNTQDIEFSNGLVSDINRGDANGTGDSFSITLEEL